MSQIDFAIAILIMIAVLTYSIVSVSNKLTNDFNAFTSSKLEESASSLSKQLFEIQDNKSLISSFKKIQASFLEIGGYQHNAIVNISITPVIHNIHVYDDLLNEITPNIVNDGAMTNITFELYFQPNIKDYVNIFYDDVPTNTITYTSNSTDTNVTGVILSEEEVYVLSRDRCSKLSSLNYGDAKNIFGFSNDFNISQCNYGLRPSLSTNVIVETTPLLIENSTYGTIYPGFATLRVWQ